MSWTVAVVLSVLGISGIFLFLNKSFDKSKYGLKVFFTMLSLAALIILAQTIKLIIEAKATGTTLTSLSLLSLSILILTIVIFSFFAIYFLITYFVSLAHAIRDSKKEKEELSWNAF